MTDFSIAKQGATDSRSSSVVDSFPRTTTHDRKHYRAKVFKSGNSLAIRIPVGTMLSAGMEMDLTVNNGELLSLEPIGRPKPKFNIAKVAGSAHDLSLISDGDRTFENRTLLCDKPSSAD